MNTSNPFAELAKLAGSGRKAAKMMGIHKSRYNRLALGRVRVSFDEIDRANAAVEVLRNAIAGTATSRMAAAEVKRLDSLT